MIQWTGNPHVHLAFEVLGYATAVCIFLWIRAHSRDPLAERERTEVLAAAAVGAAIGMRLLFWLSFRGAATTDAVGGKTIVGGLLGGLIGVEIAKAVTGIRRSTGDPLVLPIVAALAIGRIGCFLTGPIDRTAGIPTDLPWGIAVSDGIRRHPVALYEIVFLILLVPLLEFVRRASAHEGDTFRVFMLAYLAFRLGIDVLKPEPPRLAGGLTAIQYACLGGIAYFVAVLGHRAWRSNPESA